MIMHRVGDHRKLVKHLERIGYSNIFNIFPKERINEAKIALSETGDQHVQLYKADGTFVSIVIHKKYLFKEK